MTVATTVYQANVSGMPRLFSPTNGPAPLLLLFLFYSGNTVHRKV